MTGTHLDTDRLWARLTVAALAVAVCLAAFGAPVSSQTSEAKPTITNATGGTAMPGENVTVTLNSSNATEIDVTGVPDGWTVLTHRDDFGAYVDQRENRSRLLWLWSWTVSANVSVTFQIPADADPGTYELQVVPYAGKTRGEPRNVSVTVAGAQSTPTPAGTEQPAPDRTTTESEGGQSAGSSGPGFGLLSTLAGLGLFGYSLSRREER